MYYINTIKSLSLLLILGLFVTHCEVSFGALSDPMSLKLPDGYRYKGGLLLCAIGFSDGTGYYTVINNYVLSVGDEIEGYVIKKIEKTMVTLVKSKDNTELVLKM